MEHPEPRGFRRDLSRVGGSQLVERLGPDLPLHPTPDPRDPAVDEERGQLAQRLARVDAEARLAEMDEVERIARQALAEVRATVSGWRQVDLGDEVTVARDALAAAGVTLTVARDPGIALSPSAETALGLALREAVTNVVRHAGARTCTVALRRTDRRIVLEVTDDGVGGDALDGNGLTGMRERIAALGGEVQRRTRDGSALTVAVPAVVSG